MTSAALRSSEAQSNTSMPEYDTKYLETYNLQLNSGLSFSFQGAMKSKKMGWLYKSKMIYKVAK